MFDEGLKSWLSLLGETNNTFNGIPHIQNIENHVNHAVPDIIKENFSSTEIFLLLSSILLHDIGKIEVKKKGVNSDFHSTYSCNKVINEWAFLKIPNEQLARWIAIIVCSHTWDSPIPGKIKEKNNCPLRKSDCALVCEKNKLSELNFYHESSDGRVRLDWLAAILRLGDEVDNIKLRTIPNWLINSKNEESWRKYINSINFDNIGRCIKLRTIDFNSKEWKKEIKFKNKKTTYRELAFSGINSIEKVLTGWNRPLIEMGLIYEKAFIESAKPSPVLYNTKEESNLLFEPALNEQLLQQIIDSMIRLENTRKLYH